MTNAVILSASVPVIETERLILREPRLEDLEAMIAFFSGLRAGFLGGPADRFQVWGKLTGQIGHWALRGFGMWMVAERSGGPAIGRVGLNAHETWPEPELGWQVFDGYEGKGYAHEAALAARSAAARLYGVTRPISLIVPDNIRSRRLAERMGAAVESEGEVVGKPCLIYRHPEAA